MIVFVLSSRKPWLRALPQDLLTQLFVFGLAPNTCVVALKGREWLIGHPHIPLAPPLHHQPFMGAIGHGFLTSMAGRHYIWLTGTLFFR